MTSEREGKGRGTMTAGLAENPVEGPGEGRNHGDDRETEGLEPGEMSEMGNIDSEDIEDEEDGPGPEEGRAAPCTPGGTPEPRGPPPPQCAFAEDGTEVNQMLVLVPFDYRSMGDMLVRIEPLRGDFRLHPNLLVSNVTDAEDEVPDSLEYDPLEFGLEHGIQIQRRKRQTTSGEASQQTNRTLKIPHPCLGKSPRQCRALTAVIAQIISQMGPLVKRSLPETVYRYHLKILPAQPAGDLHYSISWSLLVHGNYLDRNSDHYYPTENQSQRTSEAVTAKPVGPWDAKIPGHAGKVEPFIEASGGIISGGLHASIFRELTTYLADEAIDVCVVQETHSKYDANWRGVLTIVSTKVATSSELQYHEIWHKYLLRLRHAISGTPSRHIMILAGDFNTTCVTTPKVCGKWVLPASDAHNKDNNDFMSILASYSLAALNTWNRPEHHQLATFTFGALASQIDYIICRQADANSQAKQAAIVPYFPVASWREGANHHPVQAHIRIPHHISSVPPIHMNPRIDINRVIEDIQQPEPTQALNSLRYSINKGIRDGEWSTLPQLEEGLLKAAQELYPKRAKGDPHKEADMQLSHCARSMWALFRETRTHPFSLNGVFGSWRQWSQFSKAHREHKQKAKERSKAWRRDLILKAQHAAENHDMFQIWEVVKCLAPKTKRKKLQLYRNGHMMTPEAELDWIIEEFGERYGINSNIYLLERQFLLTWSVNNGAPRFYKYNKNGPIGLQHPVGKSIMKIIIAQAKDQIHDLVKKWPQCAYVPNRSTTTALKRVYKHCAKVRETCSQHRLNLHQLKDGAQPVRNYGGLQISMDLSAAFDLVSWATIKDALEMAQIDPSVQEVLLQWLSQVRYTFQHKGMEKEKWSSDHSTMYADDTHLQWRLGMKVNTNKTKAILRLTGDPTVWIQLVEQAEYLGLIISYDNFELQSVKHRINKAHNRRWSLASVLHTKKVSVPYKLNLWRSCVLSTMLYALHSLCLGAGQICLLQRAIMRHIRAIVSDQAFQTGHTHEDIMTKYNIHTAQDLLERAHERDQQQATATDWLVDSEWNHSISRALLEAAQTKEPESDTEKAIWACPLCSEQFVSQAALKTHARRAHKIVAQRKNIFNRIVHSVGGLPQCSGCLKRFSKWQSLEIHINTDACTAQVVKDPRNKTDFTEVDASQTTMPAPEQALTPETTQENILHTEVNKDAVTTDCHTPCSGPMRGVLEQKDGATDYHYQDNSEPAQSSVMSPRHILQAEHPSDPVPQQVVPVLFQERVLLLVQKGLNAFIADTSITASMQQSCALCGQWIASQKVVKTHYQHTHKHLYQQLAHKALKLIEQKATPCVQCHFCHRRTKDWKAHLFKCTTLWQCAFLCVLHEEHGLRGPGLGRILWRGPRGGSTNDAKYVSVEPSADRESIPIHREQKKEELKVLKQDTALVLFLRPGEDSVLHHLYKVAAHFKAKQDQDATWQLGQSPLRMVLAVALLKEITDRLNQTIASQERLKKAVDQGWRDSQGGWRYQVWNHKTKQLQTDNSRPPIPEDKLLDHLATIIQCLRQPIVNRFRCTRKLMETMSSPATFKLDLSIRSHSALTMWDTMKMLQGNAVFQLAGMAFKTESLARGPAEHKIAEMIYGRR
ncbi:betA [Symbiodinium sp. CCMP2592]|nr:betA [Symbiodinium sp. CCMP2592]